MAHAIKTTAYVRIIIGNKTKTNQDAYKNKKSACIASLPVCHPRPFLKLHVKAMATSTAQQRIGALEETYDSIRDTFSQNYDMVQNATFAETVGAQLRNDDKSGRGSELQLMSLHGMDACLQDPVDMPFTDQEMRRYAQRAAVMRRAVVAALEAVWPIESSKLTTLGQMYGKLSDLDMICRTGNNSSAFELVNKRINSRLSAYGLDILDFTLSDEPTSKTLRTVVDALHEDFSVEFDWRGLNSAVISNAATLEKFIEETNYAVTPFLTRGYPRGNMTLEAGDGENVDHVDVPLDVVLLLPRIMGAYFLLCSVQDLCGCDSPGG